MGFGPAPNHDQTEADLEPSTDTETPNIGHQTSFSRGDDSDIRKEPFVRVHVETDAWSAPTWPLHPILVEIGATWRNQIGSLTYTPVRRETVTPAHLRVSEVKATALADPARAFVETMQSPAPPATTDTSTRALVAVSQTSVSGLDVLYELQSAVYRQGRDIESVETVTSIATDCGLERSTFRQAFETATVDDVNTVESQPRVTLSYGTESVSWSGLITTSDIHRCLSNWGLKPADGVQLSQAQPYSPAVTAEIASQAELAPTPDHTADRSYPHE